jgi:hypothetical protein
MKKNMLLILLGCNALLCADLSFIDKDFDIFCKQIIPELQRSKFTQYYHDIEQKLILMKQDNQLKRRCGWYESALYALDQEHKIWADAIHSFLTGLQFLDKSYDQDRDSVRTFLERYGIYKEYEQQNGIKTVQLSRTADDFWNTIKIQVTKITEKVGNWFKALRA